jgi:hypothetical protein
MVWFALIAALVFAMFHGFGGLPYLQSNHMDIRTLAVPVNNQRSTFHPCPSQMLLRTIRDARYPQGQPVSYLKPLHCVTWSYPRMTLSA